MAEWSSAYISGLPDSAFACVDGEGRHYPHHDADGNLDLPHLRAAMSRMGDKSNTQCGKAHLMAHADGEGVGKATALKATVDGDYLRVLAIPYGGLLKKAGAPRGADLDGEWFSERTDIKPDWLDVRLVDWHHGADAELRREVIGKATDLDQDTDGWWVKVWLDRGRRSVERILKIAEAGGTLFGSSETLARLVRKDSESGEILTWPYLRQTLSTSPVNHLSIVTGKALLDGYESATFLEQLPAYLAADLPTAAKSGQQGAHVDAARVEQMLDDSLAPWTIVGGRIRK